MYFKQVSDSRRVENHSEERCNADVRVDLNGIPREHNEHFVKLTVLLDIQPSIYLSMHESAVASSRVLSDRGLKRQSF